MKGEFISIEKARRNTDIEKENLELQLRILKAINYIKDCSKHVMLPSVANNLLCILDPITLEGKDE